MYLFVLCCFTLPIFYCFYSALSTQNLSVVAQDSPFLTPKTTRKATRKRIYLILLKVSTLFFPGPLSVLSFVNADIPEKSAASEFTPPLFMSQPLLKAKRPRGKPKKRKNMPNKYVPGPGRGHKTIRGKTLSYNLFVVFSKKLVRIIIL